MTQEQIDNMFAYHKPRGDQSQRYDAICSIAKSMAFTLRDCCPDSREKILAFTSLQQAVMWANASIAVNGKDSSNTKVRTEDNGLGLGLGFNQSKIESQ